MPRLNRNPSTVAGSDSRSSSVIDLRQHIPTIIAICANRLSRAASRFYREHYNIGIVDWRVLMFMGNVSKTSANKICRETDLDKGAVSRSLGVLQRIGIVRTMADGTDSRRRNLVLTGKGRALHDEIAKVALSRERYMLAGLGQDQIAAVIGVIRRIESKISSSDPSRVSGALRRRGESPRHPRSKRKA